MEFNSQSHVQQTSTTTCKTLQKVLIEIRHSSCAQETQNIVSEIEVKSQQSRQTEQSKSQETVTKDAKRRPIAERRKCHQSRRQGRGSFQNERRINEQKSSKSFSQRRKKGTNRGQCHDSQQVCTSISYPNITFLDPASFNLSLPCPAWPEISLHSFFLDKLSPEPLQVY